MAQIRSNLVAIHQFLTTNGGGNSGSMNATGDYSSTAQGFYIQPRSLENYQISSMRVEIRDAGSLMFGSAYGAIAGGLTNGVVVRTILAASTNIPGTNGTNGGGGLSNMEVRLTGPTNIRVNADWSRYAAFTGAVTNATNIDLSWDWTFSPPIALEGRKARRLEVFCQDDMSGLLSHTFFVSGRRSGIGGTVIQRAGVMVQTNEKVSGNPPPPV